MYRLNPEYPFFAHTHTQTLKHRDNMLQIQKLHLRTYIAGSLLFFTYGYPIHIAKKSIDNLLSVQKKSCNTLYTTVDEEGYTQFTHTYT